MRKRREDKNNILVLIACGTLALIALREHVLSRRIFEVIWRIEFQ
jgi:hypothetical protein